MHPASIWTSAGVDAEELKTRPRGIAHRTWLPHGSLSHPPPSPIPVRISRLLSSLGPSLISFPSQSRSPISIACSLAPALQTVHLLTSPDSSTTTIAPFQPRPAAGHKGKLLLTYAPAQCPPTTPSCLPNHHCVTPRTRPLSLSRPRRASPRPLLRSTTRVHCPRHPPRPSRAPTPPPAASQTPLNRRRSALSPRQTQSNSSHSSAPSSTMIPLHPRHVPSRIRCTSHTRLKTCT